MRLLLWLVTGLAALYGGYWVIGSRAMLSGVETALEGWKAEGLAEYDTVSLDGFPSRFDLTVTEPSWQSPDGTFHWSAPRLGIYALSYRPHHVIAVLPPSQSLQIGTERLSVETTDLRGSAVFGLAPSLPIERAQAVGTGFALNSQKGWGLRAEQIRLAIRKGANATDQDLGVELIAPELSGTLLAYLGDALPAAGQRIRLDAMLSLDAPLDRFTPKSGAQIRAADIRAFDLDWGPLGLSGSGAITVSATRQPEGQIELRIRDWRRALDVAIGLGLIRPDIAPKISRALTFLALTSGTPEDLALPLSFHNGLMSLGPVPLGPAPRL
ncbi:MAG: DUF2125 domain-containing protein [Albidovulum sp.]